ncbi:alpha/beta hydrolase [Leucobacter komagatae]|uniref:alpha/beta hydrolase n=1 Tax=Leucobacter komagatae TaxID=55969 RepID=UPI000696011D|nr:alpha/beta hydrolase [Leucobacter komagatae]
MSARVPGIGEILQGTPKAGSGDSVRAAARFVEDARQDAVSFSAATVAAQASLKQLESEAVARVEVKLGQSVLPGAAALETSAKRAGMALNRYAGEIESIHARADRLRSRTTACIDGITSAMADIEDICAAILAPFRYPWDSPPTPAMPEPQLRPADAPPSPPEREVIVRLMRDSHEARWRNTALRWQSDVEDIRAAVLAWGDLIEERREAENTLVGSLRDTPLGQLITLGAGIPGGRKRAIAVGLTGELGGVTRVVDALSVEHPLLSRIFPTNDGSGVWDTPPSPEKVEQWWGALSAAEQETLTQTVPYVIGNLPGLPAWARDRANRLSVEFYRANPQLLSPEQLKLVAEVQRIFDLEESQRRPEPPVQLLSFSLSENVPMAAVGYGDLDTASHTTFQVGGMGNDAPDGLPTWDTASRNLFDAKAASLDLGRGQAPGVVAWLGYDAPDALPSLGVLGSAAAAQGAGRLTSELDGLVIARQAGGEPPLLSVVAHSYGTTVASIALTKTTHPVDSFVMLGSAGIDVEAVPGLERLNVRTLPEGQKAIYATNASADRIAPSGAGLAERAVPTADDRSLLGLGARSPVYGGAIVFPSDGDPARGLKETDGHAAIGDKRAPGLWGAATSVGHGYFDRNTQSLWVTAEITTDRITAATSETFSAVEEMRVETFTDPFSGLQTHVRYPMRASSSL